MNHIELLGVRSIGRRGALLLVALAASIGMFCAVAAGPVTKAHAGGEHFCYVVASPHGQCGGPSRWTTWVRSYGYWHSACSNAFQGGSPVTNWACAPTHTWSNSYFDGTRWMQGVIKNNVGVNNQIWGYQEFL